MATISRVLFVGCILWQQSALAHSLTCHYTYQTFDFATIRLDYLQDGSVGPRAEVTMQGQKHTESVTKASIASDEIEHVWLSKEKPDNAVELIVYSQAQSQGNSKVINHNVPFGQDVWGVCTSSEN